MPVNDRRRAPVLWSMKRIRSLSPPPFVALLLALAPPALASAAPRPRVDPDWLRMWQQAQTHRPAHLGPEGRIAPAGEPGTPLVVEGQVFEPDGTTPAPDVVVFAYQTDKDGIYFSDSRPGSPWRLQGWVRTDDAGRFVFRTVRPGPYPGRQVPAHVHFSFESPTHGRQWSDSLRFADDPLLSEREKDESAAAGRFGGVCAVRSEDGVARVRYFVRLKPEPDF
jgi:protocatechuate 3,4-dioxygenase, beta subunit